MPLEGSGGEQGPVAGERSLERVRLGLLRSRQPHDDDLVSRQRGVGQDAADDAPGEAGLGGESAVLFVVSSM